MADQRPERGRPVRAADRSIAVRTRAARPPRAANDNAFPWLTRSSRLLPLLAAAGLLAWALVRAFSSP